MLNSLDFLTPGQPWPPESELERLKLYRDNKYLFEGKHEKCLKHWVKLLRNDKKATLEIILNWYKRLTLLWADLLLGEPPKFTAGETGSQEQEQITNYTSSKFLNTSYEVVIDISRFADGILKIRYDRGVILEGQSPAVWFPVVAINNVKEVLCHVLAWSYKVNETNFMGGKKEQWYLQVEIHEKGRITSRKYKLGTPDNCKIGSLLEEEIIDTGIDDFLVIQISNLLTTDRETGIDDYSDLDSIIQELEIRVAQMARIFDKHADPNMYGPDTALDVNPTTGEASFQGGGNYFPVGTGENPPGYVTWDGQLDSCFRELEFLMDQLYVLSETSPAAFGQLKSGLAESGSALRRLMLAPLAKVNRLRMRLDPALKKTLSLMSQLDALNGNGVFIPENTISILWQDGLPADEAEQASIMNIRTGGKPTISQRTAIKKQDNLSEADLEKELEAIQEEDLMSNPVSPAVFSFNGNKNMEAIKNVEDNSQAG